MSKRCNVAGRLVVHCQIAFVLDLRDELDVQGSLLICSGRRKIGSRVPFLLLVPYWHETRCTDIARLDDH